MADLLNQAHMRLVKAARVDEVLVDLAESLRRAR